MYTLIDFWAEWCIPCKKMAPVFGKVLPDYEDVEFVKVDSDIASNESLLRQYDIRSIPTLVLLDKDNKLMATKTGAMSEAGLRTWLDSELGIVDGSI